MPDLNESPNPFKSPAEAKAGLQSPTALARVAELEAENKALRATKENKPKKGKMMRAYKRHRHG